MICIYLIDAVTMNQTVFNKWYHFNTMPDQSHTKYQPENNFEYAQCKIWYMETFINLSKPAFSKGYKKTEIRRNQEKTKYTSTNIEGSELFVGNYCIFTKI